MNSAGKRVKHAIFLASMLLALAILVGACGQSRTITAVRPAQETSQRTVPPGSLHFDHLPPVPEHGRPTEPITIEYYADTLEAPTLDVGRATINRRASPPFVALHYRVGDEARIARAAFPPPGEITDWLPTSDSTARWQVRGAPEKDTVEVLAESTEEEPGWWTRLWRDLRGFLAAVGAVTVLGGLGYLAKELTSFSLNLNRTTNR